MTTGPHANSPARVSGNGSVTTASFTPPAGSVLVVCICSDDSTGTPSFTVTASPSLTFTQQVTSDDAADGVSTIYTAPIVTSQSYTVTTSNGGVGRISSKVYIWEGVNTTDPVGATFATGASNVTTNNWSPTVTTTATNSRVLGCATDWNALGTPTSTDTEDAFHIQNWISGLSAYKASDTSSSGTVVAVNFDASGTSNAAWTGVIVELLDSGGGAPVAKSLSDTQTFTDSTLIVGTTYTDTATEIEGTVSIHHPKTDTHFLIELLESFGTRPLADTGVVSEDVLSIAASSSLSDSLALSDTNIVDLPKSDSAALTDLLATLSTFGLSDTLSLSEAVIVAVFFEDTGALTESFIAGSAGTNIAFADSIGLLESLQLNVHVADSHSVTEDFVNITNYLADTGLVQEQLTLGFTLTDTSSLTETLNTTANVNLIDQYGVSEILEIPGVYPPPGSVSEILDVQEIAVPFLFAPFGQQLMRKSMRRWV